MTIKSYLCNMEFYLNDDSFFKMSVPGGLSMPTFQNSLSHQRFGLIIGRMK